MSQQALKKYPEWCCEGCEAKANGSLTRRHWMADRPGSDWPWTLWDGSDGHDPQPCEICGQLVPVAEPCDLGYPFFEGYEPPQWDWLDTGD